MPYVTLVTLIALLQFFFFGLQVARARQKKRLATPPAKGNQNINPTNKQKKNTQQQLVVFLPVLWMFAHFVNPWWAAGFGVVFIVGRAIYSMTYVRDPKSRELGFALTVLPTLAMAIWTGIWAIAAIVNDTATAAY